MRICYLVIIHHKFDQAIRLIKRLSDRDICFVVHVDKKVDDDSFLDFKSQLAAFPVAFAERQRGRWGSYGLALAIINCMETALDNFQFDRCVTMSGQDYPIARNSEIVEFFRTHPNAEFIEAVPKDVINDRVPPLAWTPYYRFRRYHFWIGNRRCSFSWPVKKPPALPIFHGSAWWALTRACVEQVLVEIKKNKTMRRFFKTGFMVDEAYVPTMLMATPFSNRVAKHSVTYAKWVSGSGPHPKVLTLNDFAELAESKKLFARKFDPSVDPVILSLLDEATRELAGGRDLG
jgi:hypothetical protein